MVIFHSYVSLPEGRLKLKNGSNMLQQYLWTAHHHNFGLCARSCYIVSHHLAIWSWVILAPRTARFNANGKVSSKHSEKESSFHQMLPIDMLTKGCHEHWQFFLARFVHGLGRCAMPIESVCEWDKSIERSQRPKREHQEAIHVSCSYHTVVMATKHTTNVMGDKNAPLKDRWIKKSQAGEVPFLCKSPGWTTTAEAKTHPHPALPRRIETANQAFLGFAETGARPSRSFPVRVASPGGKWKIISRFWMKIDLHPHIKFMVNSSQCRLFTTAFTSRYKIYSDLLGACRSPLADIPPEVGMQRMMP